jgi:hypothetical protein
MLGVDGTTTMRVPDGDVNSEKCAHQFCLIHNCIVGNINGTCQCGRSSGVEMGCGIDVDCLIKTAAGRFIQVVASSTHFSALGIPNPKLHRI